MDAEKGLCLPLLKDLTPLTQILISPELASAFSLTDQSAKSHASFISLSSIQQQSSSSHLCSFLPFAAKARGITIDTQTANGDLGHGGISLGPFASTTAGFNPGAALQQGGIDLNKMTESASLPLQQGVIDLNKNTESGSMPPMMNGLPYGAYERKAESIYGVGAGGGGSDSSNGGGGQPKRARTHHEAAEGAESEEGDSGGGLENSGEDQAARTLKRPRLVWTPQLHKRFVDAVAHLGIKNAVPKTIMQLMNVEGLTRENVASHLQKYRLYLKRMQGLTSEGPSVSDHLFASTPIPPALAASPSFLPAAHREDLVAIPFVPPMVPLVIPGLTPAHMGTALAYGGFDHHPYAAIMQANAKRFAAHEYRELGMDSQAPSTSPQRPILTLFPTSSH